MLLATMVKPRNTIVSLPSLGKTAEVAAPPLLSCPISSRINDSLIDNSPTTLGEIEVVVVLEVCLIKCACSVKDLPLFAVLDRDMRERHSMEEEFSLLMLVTSAAPGVSCMQAQSLVRSSSVTQ